MTIIWKGREKLESKSYVCGYCNNSIASNDGFIGYLASEKIVNIYICHKCGKPTFFDNNNQVPGPILGNSVKDVPEDVNALYDEARNCVSCNAFTASVLCCRKLLMNTAVSKGAPEGLSFIKYVEYLSDNNYVPPDGKEWVDHIRIKGNEAAHEIIQISKNDAEELINFIEMLLKIIYEFPGKIKKKTKRCNYYQNALLNRFYNI